MRTAEFSQIDQQVGDLVYAMAHQTDVEGLERHFDRVVDLVGTVDPTVVQHSTAAFAGSSILERCTEHPDQVVLLETSLMAAMYEGRSDIQTRAGVTSTEFITRTSDETAVDTLYRRLESDSGKTSVSVESQLWCESDVTCKIVAQEGDCRLIVPQYRHGMSRDIALPLGDGGRGDVMIGVFYAKNLWGRASEKVLERSETERKAHDSHALQMLLALQRSRRTV